MSALALALVALTALLLVLATGRDVVLRVLADRREERAVRPDAALAERVATVEKRVGEHHAALVAAQARGARR